MLTPATTASSVSPPERITSIAFVEAATPFALATTRLRGRACAAAIRTMGNATAPASAALLLNWLSFIYRFSIVETRHNGRRPRLRNNEPKATKEPTLCHTLSGRSYSERKNAPSNAAHREQRRRERDLRPGLQPEG